MTVVDPACCHIAQKRKKHNGDRNLIGLEYAERAGFEDLFFSLLGNTVPSLRMRTISRELLAAEREDGLREGGLGGERGGKGEGDGGAAAHLRARRRWLQEALPLAGRCLVP